MTTCEHGNGGNSFPCPTPGCPLGSEHEDLRIPVPHGYVEVERPPVRGVLYADSVPVGATLFTVLRYVRAQDAAGTWYWLEKT